MKGSTILFAIVGFCIQHIVAKAPIHTTGTEATANSFPIEEIETHIFHDNDYAPPTEEHIENEFLLNSDLAPRGKRLASSETEKSMFKKVVKCMYAALPGRTWPDEREWKVNKAFRECLWTARVLGREMWGSMHATYISIFTTTGFPATELQDGGTVYPPLYPSGWVQPPPGTGQRQGSPS
ncbi:hypothetical protein V502_03113 [Pseudogymnoascus sp. VKM F-4520 (FW-2644)]|nr:hypothetical protein V502_03113 [Pseudogymnoascus sp. VKM F-4520 (FW-2644)]